MLAATREFQKNSEPVKLPDGVEHLSFSAINTYLTCPMQYYFRYCEKIKSPPAIFLEFGSCGHEALEHNNLNKFKTGSDLPENEVVQKFSDTFADRRKIIEDWDGENPDVSFGKHVKLGSKFLSDYIECAAKDFTPEQEPEQDKYVDIGGINFKYVIDLVSGGEIYDYKFVGSPKSDADVKSSLQMWMYCYAEKKKKANLISFCKKSSDIQLASADIDANDTNWGIRIVKDTARSIGLGIFHPRKPDGQEKWVCSPKFCGYWNLCRGKKSA